MKRISLLITTFILAIGVFFLSPVVFANNYELVNIRELKEIPVVTGRFEDGANSSKVGKLELVKRGNNYQISILHPNKTRYTLVTSNGDPQAINLPYTLEAKGDLIIDSGIMFVDENGDNIIYYEFQNPSSSRKVEKNIFEDEEININGFRPYVMWNLRTGKYDVTDKVTMIGVHYAGTERRAFVDLYSNIDIEDILMVEFKWEYRMKRFLGGWTDWETQQQARYKDDKVVGTNFWNEFRRLLFIGRLPSLYKMPERLNQEGITKLNNGRAANDALLEKLNNYLRTVANQPEKTYEEMFNREHSVYRIFLDVYSKPLYTDYEIHNGIQLVDIMYEYRGEIYHPVIEDIDWTSVGGKGSDSTDHPKNNPVYKFVEGFVDWLKETFDKFYGVALIVIVIIAIVAVGVAFNFIIKFIRGLFGRQ